jgi:hypothetical protein
VTACRVGVAEAARAEAQQAVKARICLQKRKCMHFTLLIFQIKLDALEQQAHVLKSEYDEVGTIHTCLHPLCIHSYHV